MGNGFDFASKFWQNFTILICDLMRLQVLMCQYKMHYVFFIVINAYIYTYNPKQNKEFRKHLCFSLTINFQKPTIQQLD